MNAKWHNLKRVTQSLLTVLCVLLISCGTDVEYGKPLMVGGYIPDAKHPAQWSAVGLVDSSSKRVFCSATLISKNLVVTSSHCLVRKKAANIQLMFGDSKNDPNVIFLQATEFRRYKEFQKYGPNFDVAWVRFSGKAPKPFRPIEILNSSKNLKPGTSLSIAGYGKKANNCSFTDPDCKAGDLLAVQTHMRSYINENRLRNLIIIGPQPLEGPCFGDSGGPAYFRKDQSWYLVGNFMGWDKVLVPEHLPSICDTGEAIYNFTGQYVSWIEESSGESLHYNKQQNPRPKPTTTAPQTQEPQSFEQWCAYSDDSDPAWYTTQRLIRIAIEKKLEVDPSFDAFFAFTNCKAAAASLRWYIESEKHIKISGFDPSKDVDYARLEDLRPFRSLHGWGLEGITLHDHDLKDLSPLSELRSLKKLDLSGTGKVTYTPSVKIPAEPLNLGVFASLEELYLDQIEAEVVFDQLPELAHLHTVDIRGGYFDNLSDLNDLPIKSLRLEDLSHLERDKLPSLQKLETLRLENVAVDTLEIDSPFLKRLQLKEVPMLRKIEFSTKEPLEHFIVHQTGIETMSTLSNFRNLVEISIVGNQNLRRIDGIHNLPKLSRLEIINNNNTREIGSVYALPGLHTMIISGNQIETLELAEQLDSVTELILSRNNISNMSFLELFPNLERIDLSQNPIKNLRGIENLDSLESISVQNSKGEGLMSIKGLNRLPSLREINLKGNSIISANGLANFKTLEVIILSYNFIQDISKLSVLSGVKYLDLLENEIDQQICPFEDQSICRFNAIKIPI